MDAEDEQSKETAKRNGTSTSICVLPTEIFQGLEERLRAQNTSNTTKPLTTRVTTSTVKSNRHTFKDEKVESHTDKNGVCYRIGGEQGINPLHTPV